MHSTVWHCNINIVVIYAVGYADTNNNMYYYVWILYCLEMLFHDNNITRQIGCHLAGWPALPKSATYTHYGKEQLSSSMDSSINKLTNYQCATDKCWWVCFCWGLFLRPSRCPWVLKCPSSWLVQAATLLEITTQLVNDIGHALAMFCDSLSAMRPPCGPFNLENWWALLQSATLWLPTTPTLYKCLWCW